MRLQGEELWYMDEKIHWEITELLILLNVSTFAENMIKWKQMKEGKSLASSQVPRRKGPGDEARNILQSL